MNRIARTLFAGVALLWLGGPAVAQDYQAALAEIEATFGFVPGFIQVLPVDTVPGAWAELKALEVSETTALDARTKALISIAVAAQIPCQYCVWIDTQTAIVNGATDQEIREAVAMAALTRHWSTIFHGNQIDFEAFKEEFRGLAEAATAARATR